MNYSSPNAVSKDFMHIRSKALSQDENDGIVKYIETIFFAAILLDHLELIK